MEIDIEKFICSRMKQLYLSKYGDVAFDIMQSALGEQGLKYEEGKIIPIELPKSVWSEKDIDGLQKEVDKGTDEIFEELKKNPLSASVYSRGYAEGKKDAYRDMPKWKKFNYPNYAGHIFESSNIIVIKVNEELYEITIRDLLDKLPKEE